MYFFILESYPSEVVSKRIGIHPYFRFSTSLKILNFQKYFRCRPPPLCWRIPHYMAVPLAPGHIRLPVKHFSLPVVICFTKTRSQKVTSQTKAWDNFSHILEMLPAMKSSASANSFTVSANKISCSGSWSSVHKNNLPISCLGLCSPVSVSTKIKSVFTLSPSFLA